MRNAKMLWIVLASQFGKIASMKNSIAAIPAALAVMRKSNRYFFNIAILYRSNVKDGLL